MTPMLVVNRFNGGNLEKRLPVSTNGIPIIPAKGDFVTTTTNDGEIIFCWVEKIIWLLDEPGNESVQVRALEYDQFTGLTTDGWTVEL